MFKCAIIGVSGSRANGHAEAYKLIGRGQLVAVSTRNDQNLQQFADKHAVTGRYTDYREMLERERPDVVHVNTPPTVRAEIIEAAAEFGIPALIIEKPIAVEGEDYLQLCQLAAEVGVKVAVNHQLHFHPNRSRLQERVANGEIGEVRFIEASARLNMALQGTHMLQSLAAFNPGGKPVSVLAQGAGGKGLQPNSRAHYAADDVLATIGYSNGVRAILQCGLASPIAGDHEQASLHKRLAVYGTAGSAHWSMWSWEFTDRNGRREAGEHDYFEQDIQAQARLTEAMFDWLDDDAKVHPLHLGSALEDFQTLLAIYTSALQHAVVSLPFTPPANLIEKLRVHLS